MSPDAIVEEAFAPAQGAVGAARIPGAVLGVVTADGRRAVRHAGLAQREPSAEPLSRETWFDLASLTKVIFTTTRILTLVERGPHRPRRSARRGHPGSAPVRHRTRPSGSSRSASAWRTQTHLPGVEPLYTYGQDPQTLRAFVLQRVWPAGPPGLFRHQFHPARHRDRAADRPAAPGAAPSRGFSFRPDPRACAATERCTLARAGDPGRGPRRERLRARRRVRPCRPLRHHRRRARLRPVAPGRVRRSRPRASPAIRARQSERRTIGWEARYPGWSGGDACSTETIGHTGFTGTGLWIDFERGLAWSLLTNRVHPSRHADSGIVSLRRQTGEAVIRLADGS